MLCASLPYMILKSVLEHLEKQRSEKYLPQVKWVNMGGGHLMTREGYDTKASWSDLCVHFGERYPWLKAILEPGARLCGVPVI